MYKVRAYACTSPTAALAGTTIPRRDVTDRDVRIEILFCGICHSDLHQARDEWQMPQKRMSIRTSRSVTSRRGMVVPVRAAVGLVQA